MKAILKFALLSFFFLFETNLIIASNSPDLFEPQPNRRSINRPTSSLQTPRVHAAQSRCELALQTEEFYAATLLDSNNSNLQAPASTPRAMNRSESYAQIIQQQEQATQSYKSEFKQSYESQEDSTAKIYTATSFLPEQLNSPKQSPKRLDHQGSREKRNDSIEMTQLRKAIADGPDALKRYHQNRAKEQTGNGIVDKESMSFKTRNTLRQMFYESLESAGDKVIENPVNNLMNNKDFINKWKKARNDVHAQYDQQQKDRTAVLALRQLIYGTCVTRATIPTAKK